RDPIPVTASDSRVGLPYIPLPPEKIAGTVITKQNDSASTVEPADSETIANAGHPIEFHMQEVAAGHPDLTLNPLQAGIGTIANAVLNGFANSPFHNLRMYSEVLQDSTFDLFDAGKLDFASGSSITLSPACGERVFNNIDRYRDKLILRPQ